MTNPPAFPLAVPLQYQFAHDGMSLRDWFAGQALPAIARICISDTDAHDNYAQYCATRACRFADAMLAARGEAK